MGNKYNITIPKKVSFFVINVKQCIGDEIFVCNTVLVLEKKIWEPLA
jgi:hypothetical protein